MQIQKSIQEVGIQQINGLFFNPNQYFLSPLNPLPKYEKENSEEKDFLGKKIKNDADLISWLSGKDKNQKTVEDKVIQSELNYKVKKKLKNKLINNAKKCEHYFSKHYQNKEYINFRCTYCQKNVFNHNELLRFVNFEEFVYYLKYIFYLSDKVFSYSLVNFRNNKKQIDILISKFESKEENWKFNKEKLICKLCIFTLINKPDFVENIKKILMEGKTETGINYNEKLIVEINHNEQINKKLSEKKIKKKIDNKIVSNKLNNNNSNFVIPNNANIININKNNLTVLNNNYISFSNCNKENEVSYYNLFTELDNYIKNSSIQDQDLNNIYIFLYWKLLSLINHNKILEFCSYLQSHIEQLLYYVEYIQTNNDETNNNKYITIQNFYERANILFGEILKMINVTDECLRVYLEYIINSSIEIKMNFNYAFNQNQNNYSILEEIATTLMSALNLFLIT